MKKYNYSIHKELIISRIPSLFPYIEFNDENICELHSANDSINGSYGKIVPNLLLPDGKIISYNELMGLYYKNYLSEVNRKYVETAIGKVFVDKSEFNDEENDLVPEYIYLATVKGLYFEYSKMSRQCALYNKLLTDDKSNYSSHMCCYCEKYNRMGGDKMLIFLESQLNKSEEIAKDYLQFAINGSSNGLKMSINIPLMDTIDDLGIMNCYLEEWVAGKEYYLNDKVIYDDEVYECICNKTTGFYNENTEKIEFDSENWRLSTDNVESDYSYSLDGYSDSKLSSLRTYSEYLDENDESDLPEKGEDWLFFYRKGYVANYRTINDKFGNIKHFGDDYTNGNDLYAYGDVLVDIDYNTYNNEIIFTYCLDAHLKATYIKSETDDDGNVKYYYNDFKMDEINENNHHGVMYTDTYRYDNGSDLSNLIESGDFKKYVEEGIITENVIDKYNFTIFTKFEFNTKNSLTTITKDIDNSSITSAVTMSKFHSEANGKDMLDNLQNTTLYRRDYFNGISYKPTENINVYINRNNTSAFECNLKLGEIHTIEDLENYSNGGYFQIKKS